MSQVDHFIEEVTEEVRRDKLFAALRKYGWIGVLLVLLIVGGAAFNEWRKARDRAQAEALGDSLLTALEAGDQAALEQVTAEGDAAMLVTLLVAGEEADGAGLSEATRTRLEALAANAAAPARYRDLAALKLAMDGGLDAQARIEVLTPLTRAGGPYRVLAEEQLALAELEAGETEAALTRLQAILSDNDATQSLRRRATQLIVALGAEPQG